MNEIDEEKIRSRIKTMTEKLCIAELPAVLPLAVFEGLAEEEFKTIRHSLQRAFANWLREVRDELDDDPNGRSA
jgi:hypothetical protein